MVEDVTPRQAFEALSADPGAQLVDVRTQAEWAHVGLPDLSALSKRALLVQWQAPDGTTNDRFAAQLRAAGLTPEHALYFICRSGVRSEAAAEAARRAGFERVFNVADGFEGPPDAHGRRGTLAGWKADALPWRQR